MGGESNATVYFDNDAYSTFINRINSLPTPISTGFFKLLDILVFNYAPNVSKSVLEAALLADQDISAIYTPGSFTLSTSIVPGKVYYLSGTNSTVNIPASVTFSIRLPNGSSGTTTYLLTLFTSVSAWLDGYNISSITKIIPPLSYERIYNASIVNAVDNIFTTAKDSTVLSYQNIQALLGSVQISGSRVYNAVIVDGSGNTTTVPFNILYKGRYPTLTEIRDGIRNELLTSGVGNAQGWEDRIPGVFVAGRFYVIPYWDINFTKPDQVLYPSIASYKVLGQKANRILDSTGFGDITQYLDIFPAYYNRMQVGAVPDLRGLVDINLLSTIIPDYQSYALSDENFAYMTLLSQNFAKQLGDVLAIDSGSAPQGTYIPITENLLSFYSFVVGKYEICVITKACYTTIMESVQ